MKSINYQKLKFYGLLFALFLSISCSKDDEPVNTAPKIENQEFSISEGELQNPIGTVVATDLEKNALQFIIVSQSVTGAVAINENSGVLTITDQTAFDYEVNQALTATVEVSDGNLESQATITINILDVIDQPPVFTTTTFSIDENPEASQDIGEVEATDPQNLNITYTKLTGGTGDNYIDFDTVSNTLIVTSPEEFDYEKVQSYTVVMEASNGTLTTQETITININNVSPPTNGMLAHYKMNSTANNEMKDSSGNNNNATFDSNYLVPILATGFDGKQNSAFDANGTSNLYRAIMNSNPLASKTTFTIAGYVKPRGGVRHPIYSYKKSTGPTLALLCEGTSQPNEVNIRFALGGLIFNETGDYLIDGWVHIAVTSTGENWEIFINGNSVKTSSTPLFQFDANVPISFNYLPSPMIGRGALDNFILYDRILTQDEIRVTLKEED